MALQKNKMTVEGDTYEIAQAHNAQFKANSDDKDTGNSITWTESEPLENEELNSSIFNKMSKMFSNVRYLYNELGVSGTSTGSSISIKKKLDDIENGKANVSHDHIKSTYKEIAAELPVINWQENRSDKVPTASLIPPMQAVINNVIIPNLNSAQSKYDAVFKNPANERYRGKDLGVWSKVSDVDTFCTNHNSANGYKGLCLGDYVTIMDGTYNAQWMIAGFDTEVNNGSNNGVGICMIPKGVLGTYPINSPTYIMWTTSGTNSNTRQIAIRGYWDSGMNNFLNNTIAPLLQKVLGAHLINRYIKLNNASALCWDNGADGSSNYNYHTSFVSFGGSMIETYNYLTLMTSSQVMGLLATDENVGNWNASIYSLGDGRVYYAYIFYTASGNAVRLFDYIPEEYFIDDYNSNILNGQGSLYMNNAKLSIPSFSSWYFSNYSRRYSAKSEYSDWVAQQWVHTTRLPIFNFISPDAGVPYFCRDRITNKNPETDNAKRFYVYDKNFIYNKLYEAKYMATGNTTVLLSNAPLLSNSYHASYRGVRPFMYIR